MYDWLDDNGWQAKYETAIHAIIAGILGRHPEILLARATSFADRRQATDAVSVAIPIGIRLRRPEYFPRFADEFTLRSKRDTGAETEVSKVRAGHGKYCWYGFAAFSEPRWGDQRDITAWHFLSLDEWRQRDSAGLLIPAVKDKPNGDGTYFNSYSVAQNPTLVIERQRWQEPYATIKPSP